MTKYFNLGKNKKWSRVEGWRYRGWSKTNYHRRRALAWADDKVSRHHMRYSLWTSKSNQHKGYCSSFVWQSYRRQGVDLDRDGGPSVWPNDLRRHRHTRMFNAENK
jgi:uncharacterized protein YycO